MTQLLVLRDKYNPYWISRVYPNGSQKYCLIPNYHSRMAARSAIRLAVKKDLRRIVPFSELDSLLKEVLEQAKGQFKDWPLVG